MDKVEYSGYSIAKAFLGGAAIVTGLFTLNSIVEGDFSRIYTTLTGIFSIGYLVCDAEQKHHIYEPIHNKLEQIIKRLK